MIKSILVAIDGSPYAATALEYAAWMAERLEAQVKVLFVRDRRLLEGPMHMSYQILPGGIPGGAPSPKMLSALREELEKLGEQVLEQARAMLEARGLGIDLINEAGIVDETILAASRSSDLIVMGAKGQHAEFTHNKLGSTTDRVIRQTIEPVLVCPESFVPVSRAVMAYDQSGPANKALHIGCELVHLLKIELLIVNVIEKGEVNESNTVLSEAAELARSYKIRFETQAAEGHPEETIHNTIKKKDGQLLVMGLSARRRIIEMFLGSTATHVLNKAEYPVLVVN